MHISLNWIKDFVDVPAMSPKELASLFTLTTAEVEDVITQGEALRPILCVEIKSVRPHPEADKLNLVTFDYGQGTKEVVCGAPNVKVGLRVPYAPIGTTLPNGMTLEPKKIRGVLSDGMLCSEVELGLGDGKAGLMELNDKATPGLPLLQYLNLKPDTILDVDNKSLTHRPDLWGHFGLAREFSTMLKVPFKDGFTSDWAKKIESKFNSQPAPISIDVSNDSSCLAYWGISIDNVSLGPTPEHIKTRLEAVGLRSINLLVDISNYVMVELGIPNHVFDRDKIKGDKLFIKKASDNQKFTTLDEVNRDLLSSDTVICDSERPLVLAGLMGGLESGVTEQTKKIFIEVANWEASEVRKTSVRLGLRTDSSQRYEKTLDSNLCYRTLLRMVELVSEFVPGATVIGAPQKFIREDKLSRPLTLAIEHGQITSALGMEIPQSKVVEIFNRLDFKVVEKGDLLEVTVPTYRTTKDISCKADLIEEIGRVIGYDNISPVAPLLPVRPVRLSLKKQFHRKIEDFLVLHGQALQIMTYPLTGKELLEKAAWPEKNDSLTLVNALSVEADRMRPSLIPSALEMVNLNQKHYDSFAFFELGRSYQSFNNERSQLLVGLYSRSHSRFPELVNLIEKLLSALNIPGTLSGKNEKYPNPLIPSQWQGVHPHEYVNVQVMGKFLGALNTVHPLVLKSFKMKGHLSLAVLDLTDIEDRELKDKSKYSPLSKFPSSSCDFTVVMPKDDSAVLALNAIKVLKDKEIKSRSILDVFVLNETQKAVSFRVTFEDPEKTLSSQAIKELELKVVQILEKAGFPLKT